MRVVLVTIPTGSGEEMARLLVEREVCACVNVLPGARSFYKDEGELKRKDEELLVIKVAEADIGVLRTMVLENHPYDTPEFVALEVDIHTSDNDYVRWVRYATRM